jgi:flavin-dependent dehydrogenase
MQVRTLSGAWCDLEHPAPFACGLDRVRLESVLLELAADAGASVHLATPVVAVTLPGAPGSQAVLSAGTPERERVDWHADLVVGADGPRSIVARAAGVDRSIRWFRRAGLTVHHAHPGAGPPGEPATATLTAGPGWYCGVAPVPGGRVNVGVVLGVRRLAAELARHGDGPGGIIGRVVDDLPGPREAWRTAQRTDAPMVAVPLAHRPRRLAGAGWLLVGDAAGFVDPLSGEGIHRALSSAALAVEAILGARAGRTPDLDGYHARMQARTRAKDAVSWLLQGFLASPAVTEYAVGRLQRRPDLARTFGAVLADRVPATRALDPRFLARLLLP